MEPRLSSEILQSQNSVVDLSTWRAGDTHDTEVDAEVLFPSLSTIGQGRVPKRRWPLSQDW